MTHHEIAMIALLLSLAASIYAVWLTQQSADAWRKAWLRDTTELLQWKRYGLMRDPKTGRYVKKDK